MTKRGKMCRLMAWVLTMVVFVTTWALAETYPYETQSAENVNLRRTASASALVLKRIPAGAQITVVGESGGYYKITFDGATGFAMKQYIDGASTAGNSATNSSGIHISPSAIDSYPYETTTISEVKLRKSAASNATVVTTVPADSVITIMEMADNGFAKAVYRNRTGYVMGTYVHLINIPTPSLAPSMQKYATLQSGQSGSMVRALQEAMTELGFYTGTADAKFGEQTKTAVAAFQKRNSFTETGVANEEMQLLLFEGNPRNSKGIRQEVKTVPLISGITIISGAKGEAVDRLQERLKELGYYTGEINGTYDRATVSAVQNFQRKHGIADSGKADPETQNALYGAAALSAHVTVTPTPAPIAPPPQNTVREGDSGDDARAVQQRLKDLGYYTGSVDGKFGAASVRALKAFQEKSGIANDGVCGSQTRNMLFGEAAAYAQATPAPVAATTPPVSAGTTVTIKPGSRGNAVLLLQQRLETLGYYASRQDGVYLEDDISAVRAFQRANGLTVDGKAGFKTQSVLYSADAVGNGAEETAAGAALRVGSKGAEVSALQNRLIELGYLSGIADGTFGSATRAALISFQRANKLSADGVAGSQTQSVLNGADPVRNQVVTAATATLKEGAAGSAVTDLQNRLIALGYLSGRADGKFGPKTVMALIDFQKRNNLTIDGVAGAKTLTALNNANAKPATDAPPAPVPGPIALPGTLNAANVRYANWYSEIRARARMYPNATVYDYNTGISWQVHMFSLGAHADAEPISAADTANMNRAFGGKTTWTPKPVWVVLSDGSIYLATTHNTPHDTSHRRDNDFAGHLCIHFPRTASQVASIGPYATSHQTAIDVAWPIIQQMATR